MRLREGLRGILDRLNPPPSETALELESKIRRPFLSSTRLFEQYSQKLAHTPPYHFKGPLSLRRAKIDHFSGGAHVVIYAHHYNNSFANGDPKYIALSFTGNVDSSKRKGMGEGLTKVSFYKSYGHDVIGEIFTTRISYAAFGALGKKLQEELLDPPDGATLPEVSIKPAERGSVGTELSLRSMGISPEGKILKLHVNKNGDITNGSGKVYDECDLARFVSLVLEEAVDSALVADFSPY